MKQYIAVVKEEFLDQVLSNEDEEERTLMFQFWAGIYNKVLLLEAWDDEENEIFSVHVIRSQIANLLPKIEGAFLTIPFDEIEDLFLILNKNVSKKALRETDFYNFEHVNRQIAANGERFIQHIKSGLPKLL